MRTVRGLSQLCVGLYLSSTCVGRGRELETSRRRVPRKSSSISPRLEPETADADAPQCFTSEMPQRSPSEYVQLGRDAILHLLGQEHAAPWIEVEAKIADVAYGPVGIRVEPHHLSNARSQLVREGVVRTSTGPTRGGSEVTILHLAGASGRRFDDAAARKRILAARYYGWARGTRTRPGRFGAAGEKAVRDALLAAAPSGYTIEKPGREVETLLGVPMIGPLDAAAHYLVRDADGIPGGVITVPIEVKNLRDWIYPSSREHYQLLSKAAVLQDARPTRSIAPVFVCRRAHITTMRMAKQLGFFIIPIERQYVHQVDEDALIELRAELGLIDLVQQEGIDDRLVRFFQVHLPKVIERTANDWSDKGLAFLDEWSDLNKESDAAARVAILGTIRANFREFYGVSTSGW